MGNYADGFAGRFDLAIEYFQNKFNEYKMTTFEELKNEALKEKKSILVVLREKTDEKFNAFREKKNVKRFREDITEEIRKRERIIEDLGESLIDAIRDAGLKTRESRLRFVTKIDNIQADIEQQEEEIARLIKFQEEYL